jgi:hypothetical protein
LAALIARNWCKLEDESPLPFFACRRAGFDCYVGLPGRTGMSVAQELPANIVASTDAATGCRPTAFYMLVHQYQQSLNAGSTEATVDLFTAAAIE